MPYYPNPCQALVDNFAAREAALDRAMFTPPWQRHSMNPEWVKTKSTADSLIHDGFVPLEKRYDLHDLPLPRKIMAEFLKK